MSGREGTFVDGGVEWQPERDEDYFECPDCDGDGYIDILDHFGDVLGPAPCPRGCHPSNQETKRDGE